ncbi:MAG TPA: histidine kinase [Rhodospirillaceae bacterium]|nr:MAG: hypothetical protein A2018_02285 [Alphaproteobacteria bacterium GWF2_58_20]HAU29524.1 histidine kinase [Rhodospirillaceae bacterium]
MGSFCASPERSDPAEIAAQVEKIHTHSDGFRVLDAVFGMTMVLNQNRQIIHANPSLLRFLGASGQETVIGLRPGEVLSCINAPLMDGGCGTSEFCQTCGAVAAITHAIAEKCTDVQECRILRQKGLEALDLRVAVVPISLAGEDFFVVTLVDISHEKRRQVLERLFFHDIMNTAGALRGYVEMTLMFNDARRQKYEESIKDLSDMLFEEISAHRDLARAENGDLVVVPRSIHVRAFLERMHEIFSAHPAAEGRQLVMDPESCDVEMFSDAVLLQRVLGNMIRNSLEATPTGETTIMGCRMEGGMVGFFTKNPGEMAEDVRLQMFHRSFSTKGPGRGLGTYSMKLLGEHYLHGHIHFSSSKEDGTLFMASFPRLWLGDEESS